MSKLIFTYGAMNSGKSTVLLQVAHNYEEQGMRVLVIKPSIDTKAGANVQSRLGVERQVDVLLAPNELLIPTLGEKLEWHIYRPAAIIVDEAQFLTPSQVDELFMITKIYNIPVLAYGLRCDFQMQGFPGSTRLLEVADEIREQRTICKCGKKATQNVRLIDGIPSFQGNQVAIDGEADIAYTSMCGKCYLEAKEEAKNHGQIR